MSYSEAMAKHYHEKQKDGNTEHQLKDVTTYLNKNRVTINSNFKLDSDTISLANELARKNFDNCDYFIDSPIYSDEYMKKFNKELASAETVDELATYLGNLDESIKVIKADNHVEKGLVLEQWSTTSGIHLQTYFYI